MKYRIAIPSYKRARTFKEKTLAYLLRTDIDPSRIDLFVADSEEFKIYSDELGENFPGNIIIAEPGMRAVRNFIQTYYPQGTLVFNLDDDVKQLIEKVSDKKAREVSNLDALIQLGFSTAKKAKATLWGIYPVKNPFFMKHTVRCGLWYIEGAVWGVIIDHDPALAVTLDDKEDFERSILHFLKDGNVIRLDWFSMVSNFYKEPGGMQEERTMKRIQESAQNLRDRFPRLTKWNTTKKSKYPEVKLVNPKR